ncbi:MAG: RNA methyltransferase [Deltaproteobacteria bacterium]|nr:RNA methyltransferase [Deltaproteobacteria bacterium]
MEITPLSKNMEKWIRKLHQKKYRDEQETFMAEGMNALAGAREGSLYEVMSIVLEHAMIDELGEALPGGIPLYSCTRKTMETLSTEKTSQGIVLVCRLRRFSLDVLSTGVPRVLMYCDRVSDPGNLGTIVRTARWFGLRQIILSPFCVDHYNPKVIRSTAGTFFQTAFIAPVDHTELSRFARENGYHLAASVPRGGEPLQSLKKDGKYIFMMGNESEGLPQTLIREAAVRISINGGDDTESLNLGVAASIILYELLG